MSEPSYKFSQPLIDVLNARKTKPGAIIVGHAAAERDYFSGKSYYSKWTDIGMDYTSKDDFYKTVDFLADLLLSPDFQRIDHMDIVARTGFNMMMALAAKRARIDYTLIYPYASYGKTWESFYSEVLKAVDAGASIVYQPASKASTYAAALIELQKLVNQPASTNKLLITAFNGSQGTTSTIQSQHRYKKDVNPHYHINLWNELKFFWTSQIVK